VYCTLQISSSELSIWTSHCHSSTRNNLNVKSPEMTSHHGCLLIGSFTSRDINTSNHSLQYNTSLGLELKNMNSNEFKMSDGRHLEFSEHLYSGSFITIFLGNKMAFKLSWYRKWFKSYERFKKFKMADVSHLGNLPTMWTLRVKILVPSAKVDPCISNY